MITDSVYQSLIGQSQAETGRQDRKSSEAAQMGMQMGRQIQNNRFQQQQMSLEQERYEKERVMREAMFDLKKREGELQFQDMGLKYQASRLDLNDKTEQARLDTQELPILNDYSKTLESNPEAQVPVFKSKSLQNQALQLQRAARTSSSAQTLQKVNEDNLLNQNKQVTDWLVNNPDKTIADVPQIKNQQGQLVPNMGLITNENRAKSKAMELEDFKTKTDITTKSRIDLIEAKGAQDIQKYSDRIEADKANNAAKFKDKAKLSKYNSLMDLAKAKLSLAQNEAAQQYINQADSILLEDQGVESPSSSVAAEVTTDAEYQALPSGSVFTSNGKKYKKP